MYLEVYNYLCGTKLPTRVNYMEMMVNVVCILCIWGFFIVSIFVCAVVEIYSQYYASTSPDIAKV